MSAQEKGPASLAGQPTRNSTSLLRKAWASYALSSQTWQGFWLGFVYAEIGALRVLVGQLIFNMVRP